MALSEEYLQSTLRLPIRTEWDKDIRILKGTALKDRQGANNRPVRQYALSPIARNRAFDLTVPPKERHAVPELVRRDWQQRLQDSMIRTAR